MLKVILCICLFSFGAAAQEPSGGGSKSKIETLYGKSHTVLLTRSQEIGILEGWNVSSASVHVMEVTDAASGTTIYGVQIAVVHEGAKRGSSSFIDFEDLEPV